MGKIKCPDCNGRKIIVGNCECNSEWRSVDADDNVDDCICDPDVECKTCSGTGYITEPLV